MKITTHTIKQQRDIPKWWIPRKPYRRPSKTGTHFADSAEKRIWRSTAGKCRLGRKRARGSLGEGQIEEISRWMIIKRDFKECCREFKTAPSFFCTDAIEWSINAADWRSKVFRSGKSTVAETKYTLKKRIVIQFTTRSINMSSRTIGHTPQQLLPNHGAAVNPRTNFLQPAVLFVGISRQKGYNFLRID